MNTLSTDPISWSAKAVSSRFRFWFMVVILALLQAALVHSAVAYGWRGAVTLAAFLAWFQFMLLFALRALYMRIAQK